MEKTEEQKMKIVLDEGAVMPTRAHQFDAGLDLYAPEMVVVPASYSQFGNVTVGAVTIDTGVHVQIPQGCVGMLKSKSGLNCHYGITGEGVIDSGYTGSIHVKLYNHTGKAFQILRGEKSSQLVILPCVLPDLEVVDHLDDTERGTGGFGSTGR